MSGRYELWQLCDRNHEGPVALSPAYPWMVYSVSGMKCRWFADEESARSYFAGVVAGEKERGDAYAHLAAVSSAENNEGG